MLPPPTCPACRATVAERSMRCTQCGVALGEDNRCGCCLAVAPVFERSGRYVCSACGEDRALLSGTVVASEAALVQIFEELNALRPSRAPWHKAALPVAAALVLAWVIERLNVSRNVSIVLVVLAIAASAAWWVRSQQARARALGRRRYEIEQRIIGLAYRSDGRLTPTTVSEVIRISVAEANALLIEFASSGRASIDRHAADDPSETVYLFAEARRTQALRRSAAN